MVEVLHHQKDDPPDDEHPCDGLDIEECLDLVLEDKTNDGKGKKSKQQFHPQIDLPEGDLLPVDKHHRQDGGKLYDNLIRFGQIVLRHPQKPGGNDHMPCRGDRQKLRKPFDDPDDHRLYHIHVINSFGIEC